MTDSRSTWLTYLQVTSHTRPFLLKCYDRIDSKKAKEHAYHNAERFIYEVKLGEEYLSAAASTPLSVQPLLYYYGMTHYLKSCLLTVDPGYPATAKVLAHGLSTRKRKKMHYRFLEDDVRIQPNGLFPYAAKHLFHQTIDQNKLSMDELLRPLLFMEPIYSCKGKEAFPAKLPELLAHFAILYNLSMLVRYEGEWWGRWNS
ncbi:YaaC family protein [Halobacillus amylolyticus]|uniref:YaaC family protein n=1 Tax=Halobacillus amylolyticus TaxID=2932259 RepID=A0ABY4H815_9BACI|nr:YaaC family protein [Halobacillus amylolyticus]UOR10744.1 YaaC family protein [Halobacillus amylolyticus]